jgi:glycosyltransferase involved in cell wall biosynthesis
MKILLNNTMKVLEIFHELKFSGAEIMYVDAASFLREKGCELTAMATGSNVGDYISHFEQAGYNIIHKSYPARWNFIGRLRYWLSFIRLIKNEAFDVIHIHSHSLMWEMAFAARLAKKQSVFTFHSVFPSHFYSYPYHRFQRWSAKKIFGCKFQSISDSVHDHELTFYNNKTNKINNWYGNNRFYPANKEEKTEVRKELDISSDALVLITVGGCSSNKRHSEVIKALPRIIEDSPSVVYLHLGVGEMEENEVQLATKLKVNGHIQFCKNQSDVRKYLIASDIYIMPSEHEGMPITTIEAMASGIPAILYNVPGLRDFNKYGEHSLLIPEDYELLAYSVIYLHLHPDVSNRLSNNAIEFVNKTYNLQTNVSEIFKLYS